MMRTTFTDGCIGAASNAGRATVPAILQQFHTPHNQDTFINSMKVDYLVQSDRAVSETTCWCDSSGNRQWRELQTQFKTSAVCCAGLYIKEG